jgi:hypothetical protein
LGHGAAVQTLTAHAPISALLLPLQLSVSAPDTGSGGAGASSSGGGGGGVRPINPDVAVFSYLPKWDTDPLNAGALWSFNFFFYNRALKKVLFLAVVARRCVTRGRGGELGGCV